MWASTPRTDPRTDLRKRSLMLKTPVISSPLRRTEGVSDKSLLMEQTDDEQERTNRRSMVAMQRRLTNISTTPSGSPLTNQITDELKIKDHLRVCTQLYTENKISAKNVWELRIIDIMRRIASSELDNVLQVAGSSLDVGTKVYALRVDDVHTKGLKLASSISTASEGDNAQDNVNGDGTVLEPVKRKGAKKKRKMLLGDKKNVIDKEGKSLFEPLKELEPVLFSTKENIEVSATDNLFTYKLHTHPSFHEIMLMSGAKYRVIEPDSLLREDGEIDVEYSKVLNYMMYQPFKDFEIGQWDPDEEEKQLNDGCYLPTATLDENGLPIPELDGSIHDIFQEDDGPISDIEEHQEEFHAQVYGEVAHIVDAIPEEDRIETDYGYNAVIRTHSGKLLDRIWAGPSHWKVKFNRRSNLRFSGSTVQQVVKHARRPKTQQPVEFDQELEDLNKRKKVVLKRASASANPNKVTFPFTTMTAEKFYKEVYSFLCKPDVWRPKLKTAKEEQECEVNVYNYENASDSLYCPENSDDRDDAEPMENNSFEHEEAAAACENFMGENLVNVPEMVAASQVPYALQAKKMDMKKLRKAVWECLTEDSSQENVSTITPVTFSNVYRDLPSHLNKEMNKELSCPLAFVALLHECNEKQLLLEQDPTLKDFTIKKAVQADA